MTDLPPVVYGLAVIGGTGGAWLSGKAILSIIRGGKIATKPGFPELSPASRPGAFWFFVGFIAITGLGMASAAITSILHLSGISN
jgi:hypothetical protein